MFYMSNRNKKTVLHNWLCFSIIFFSKDEYFSGRWNLQTDSFSKFPGSGIESRKWLGYTKLSKPICLVKSLFLFERSLYLAVSCQEKIDNPSSA